MRLIKTCLNGYKAKLFDKNYTMCSNGYNYSVLTYAVQCYFL